MYMYAELRHGRGCCSRRLQVNAAISGAFTFLLVALIVLSSEYVSKSGGSLRTPGANACTHGSK